MGYDYEALLRARGYVITGDRAVRVSPQSPPPPAVVEAVRCPGATRAPLVLTLPYPPSINHYYIPIAWGKKVLTQAGRDYRKAVATAVTTQCPGHAPFTGRLSVTLIMHAPDHRERDLDDILKAPLDAMQHAGIYLKDSQIDDLHPQRGAVQRPGHLHITLALL